MDNRLEPVDKLMDSVTALNSKHSPIITFMGAKMGVEEDNPATLYWLAACAIDLADCIEAELEKING